ncbi:MULTISPECIES: bacillithiol biosynthesis deacetylase BshB1 [unclassified Paenibacillus]|uniref:bacillithiol biosynthesis deacetylase BshB1 n=1 Tax=unclassified Paenibacillus TaxID=185978 RepID=UPI0007109095|nr:MULTISPECIES: bacillithiol biosynthesis deacetylase BshB1 [unclassified Paenibacillus]KQX68726.1 bacillithiol biosynthesis deacetylase BshB1 [Paenibacillus sp. Root444D2]KRE32390.1 bacillithiol biosynthesis deacetylase BshB1 [Paenibacillus sp. Soil724D2]
MSESLDILIFGAHADDAEIGMGATIAKHTKSGLKVGLCDLTYAEMSSNGTVETRIEEAEQAASILGVKVRTNLGLPDRGLFATQANIERITQEIRKFKPRIVFAPYWQDRHPDHVACSGLVQEAVFNAKLRKYLPDSEPVNVEQMYFYFINDVYEADLMVDVTDCYDEKIAALSAYRSQFISGQGSVATPLNQGYIERVEARDRLFGQKRLLTYAEGFVSKLPLVVDRFV